MVGKREIVVVALFAGLVVWLAGENAALGKDLKIKDPGFNKNQFNQPQINKDLLKQAKPNFKPNPPQPPPPPPGKKNNFDWQKFLGMGMNMAGQLGSQQQHHHHYYPGHPGYPGGYPGSGYPASPPPTMMLRYTDLGVAEFMLDRDAMRRGEHVVARAIIVNESNWMVRGAQVRFFVDGRPVHEDYIDIDPFRTAEVAAPIWIEDPGRHMLHTEVRVFGEYADEHPRNNVREAAIDVVP